MKTFRIGAQGIIKARRDAMLLGLGISLSLLIFNLPKILTNLNELLYSIEPDPFLVGLNLVSLAFGPVLYVVFGVVVAFASFRQQNATHAALEFQVTETNIVRREVGKPEKQIAVSEVSQLEDLGDSVIVWGGNRQSGMDIPKTLDGFQDLEQSLMTRGVSRKSSILQMRVMLIGTCLAVYGSLFLWRFGTDRWLGYAGSFFAMILLVYFYWRSRPYAKANLKELCAFPLMIGCLAFIVILELGLALLTRRP